MEQALINFWQESLVRRLAIIGALLAVLLLLTLTTSHKSGNPFIGKALGIGETGITPTPTIGIGNSAPTATPTLMPTPTDTLTPTPTVTPTPTPTPTPSPTPLPSNGLTGTYYDNADFTGFSFSRIDPTIDFNWTNGSPDPSIGNDTFSVRWVGKVLVDNTQTYTFFAKTSDGVRLWVNNQLLIDKWVNRNTTENSATINLVGGQKYDIKMEYYENTNAAVAQLRWKTQTISKQIIPSSHLFTF